MAGSKGVLLVGSVPLPDSEAVFKRCSAGLPHRLKRIPDGETGARHYFTLWQASLFAVYPPMLAKFVDNALLNDDVFTPEQIKEGMRKVQEKPLETGYDTAAIDSYQIFKELKAEGVIPKDIRFQVCLPTPPNVLSAFVQSAFQALVYPLYEEALYRAMKNIQEHIPHEELAIQIDLAVDTAFWEGVYLQPWFKDQDVKAFVMDYIIRMIEQVDQDVELGFHNCYGDMEHRHWFEPKSLKAVSERGLAILSRSPHKVAFFHAPVPVSTMSFLDTFLEPLKEFYPKLKEQGGELFLGVVQYNDLEGTKKRIEAVSKIIPEFGIATECGWGRTPQEQIEDIMKLSTEVSEPVH